MLCVAHIHLNKFDHRFHKQRLSILIQVGKIQNTFLDNDSFWKLVQSLRLVESWYIHHQRDTHTHYMDLKIFFYQNNEKKFNCKIFFSKKFWIIVGLEQQTFFCFFRGRISVRTIRLRENFAKGESERLEGEKIGKRKSKREKVNQILICVSDSLWKCLLFRFQTQHKYCITAKPRNLFPSFHETFFFPSTEPFSFLPFLPSIIIHSFLPFPVLFMPSFLLLSSFSFCSSPSLFHCLTLSLSLFIVTGSLFSFLFFSIFHVSFNSQTEYVAFQSQVDSLFFYSSLSLPDFCLTVPYYLSLSLG